MELASFVRRNPPRMGRNGTYAGTFAGAFRYIDVKYHPSLLNFSVL
jgi:hypothetical protein